MKNKRFLAIAKVIEIYTAFDFTAMMCIITLVGFILKLKAIPYSTVGQLIIIAFICGTLQWFAFSDDVFKRLSYIWRIAIFMIPLLGMQIGFAVKFQWFPVHDTRAWVIFLGIFLGCIFGCIIAFEIYYRITGNKYNNLLKDYKKKREVKEDTQEVR